MTDLIISSIYRDYTQHGDATIARVRKQHPAVYMKLITQLVPKEHKVEHTNALGELSDDQLAAMIEHVRADLENRLANQRVAKVIDGRAVVVEERDAKGIDPKGS